MSGRKNVDREKYKPTVHEGGTNNAKPGHEVYDTINARYYKKLTSGSNRSVHFDK